MLLYVFPCILQQPFSIPTGRTKKTKKWQIFWSPNSREIWGRQVFKRKESCNFVLHQKYQRVTASQEWGGNKKWQIFSLFQMLFLFKVLSSWGLWGMKLRTSTDWFAEWFTIKQKMGALRQCFRAVWEKMSVCAPLHYQSLISWTFLYTGT